MKKPILVWDEEQSITDEVEHRMGNKEEYNISFTATEDDVRQQVYSEDLTYLWDDLSDALTEEMVIIKMGQDNLVYNPYWIVAVEGFGWRNLSGIKIVRAITGEALLGSILPNTNNMFKIFKPSKKRLKIQNFHHDSPMGEWYSIRPMTDKEMVKYEEDGTEPDF